MTLKSRKITEADYPIINKWCKDWKFPEIAEKLILPEYGLIISDKYGVDVVAGFLYLTDSIIAHPEWIITNKKYINPLIRKWALTKLLDELATYAKKNGYESFIVSVKDKFLIRALENNGFSKTDTNMTNLIKNI